MPSNMGVIKLKCTKTMSSSLAQGWKKQCFTFEKHMSTFSPFCVKNRTPFWCISRLPWVFLPTRFGRMTKLSRDSLRIDFRGCSCSSWCSWCCTFSSDSVSDCFTCFRHSFIDLQAVASRLFEDEDLVFMVSSFTQRAAGSSIAGYCIDAEGYVWKLMRKNVHCP